MLDIRSSPKPPAPALAYFSNSMIAPKLDFTKYGIPSREWTDFAATHPAQADADRLPSHDSDSSRSRDAPRLPSGRPKAARQSLAQSAVHNGDEARVEERTVHEDGPDGRGRLNAWVYTKVLSDDDLQLDSPLPCVIYLHSGGYGLLGGPETEHHLCEQMAARLRVVVVHVCYRETPPNRHPAPHEDARDGLAWVIDHAEELGIDRDLIVLVGMCFGAGLAADVALRACARDRDARLKGLLLGFPWLFQENMFPYDRFASRGSTSRYQCAAAPMMSKRVYDDLQRNLGIEDQGDPRLNVPLAAEEDLADFPRTAFILAGNDLLRDDGILFAEKLRSLGVPRRVHLFPGMPHAFRRHSELWSSKRFDQVLMLLINWVLERTLSSDDLGVHIEEPQEEQRKEKPPFVTKVLV